jgi:hypothetical protein
LSKINDSSTATYNSPNGWTAVTWGTFNTTCPNLNGGTVTKVNISCEWKTADWEGSEHYIFGIYGYNGSYNELYLYDSPTKQVNTVYVEVEMLVDYNETTFNEEFYVNITGKNADNTLNWEEASLTLTIEGGSSSTPGSSSSSSSGSSKIKEVLTAIDSFIGLMNSFISWITENPVEFLSGILALLGVPFTIQRYQTFRKKKKRKKRK